MVLSSSTLSLFSPECVREEAVTPVEDFSERSRKRGKDDTTELRLVDVTSHEC